MGKLVFYSIDGSPPCRAVLLTLKALNVPYEYKLVNLLAGENRKPEYLAINPHGTVPTLTDDNEFITDSNAIITYLVDKYSKDDDDSLYPKELIKRAKVNQFLFYTATVILERTLFFISKPIFRSSNVIPQAKIEAAYEVYKNVESFLEQHSYVVADELTVADFSLVAVLTTLFIFAPLDVNKYPKINNWVKRLEELPYYAEANGVGLKAFSDVIKSSGIKVLN